MSNRITRKEDVTQRAITGMPRSRSVLIFGKSGLSQLAAYSIGNDGGRKVEAFVVDDDYRDVDTVDGLPVIASSSVALEFPPEAHDMLVPIGFSRMNALRLERCSNFSAKGYGLANFVASSARVWPECNVMDNVLVYENAIIQPYVTLGRNIIIRAAANIGHHSVVEDHCFIASGVTTGGDVTIGERSVVGLGAVIRDGVRVAQRSFIGAGAVVLADTEPDGVYVGNPARRLSKSSHDVT